MRRFIRRCCLLGLVIATNVCQLSFVDAGDWARFRGPNGSGISADENPVPTRWSETQNIKWKTALPGPGSSSPIVVGEKVFVTCWTGYGIDRENPGEQRDLKMHLLCLNRHTGDTIWSDSVEPVLPEEKYEGMFAEHGYASSTPVSDGERVYVYFGRSGALAFDLEGNRLWQTSVGTEFDPRHWGSASSPILYKDVLIITATAECEAIVGLDKKTGQEVWRQEAEGFGGAWGTPVLVKVDEDRTDLVLGVPFEIWGLSPDSGKLRWYCEAMYTDAYCASLVVEDDVVYGIEGRVGGSIAVRAGGKGDVVRSHVVWTGTSSCQIRTPIIYDGRIYYFSRRIANCVDARTGKRIFRARLDQGSESANRGSSADYSSPVIADGKIYFVSRSGNTFVLTAGKSFEQLATNRITSEPEDFSATPAVSGGQLFIRSSKHLYCIAEAGE